MPRGWHHSLTSIDASKCWALIGDHHTCRMWQGLKLPQWHLWHDVERRKKKKSRQACSHCASHAELLLLFFQQLLQYCNGEVVADVQLWVSINMVGSHPQPSSRAICRRHWSSQSWQHNMICWLYQRLQHSHHRNISMPMTFHELNQLVQPWVRHHSYKAGICFVRGSLFCETSVNGLRMTSVVQNHQGWLATMWIRDRSNSDNCFTTFSTGGLVVLEPQSYAEPP